MSDLLIKGMEMPKYCCHCRFESSSIHGQYCILTKKFTRLDDNEDGSERHISCPLVEVPTHGDWHTGTPTEKGTYLVNDGLNDYAISYFDGEKFSSVYFPNKEVIRLWQKIEPFEASIEETK